MSRAVVWCGGGGCNKRTLCAYTPRHNNNIPCVSVSILLCSSPDVNETEIEIWREKTHYYTKVIFTIFVYYNVGSNLASTPQRLSAGISPLRRPFRSERFNARRRRQLRPRRATKKPYNSNNNNTIVLYYTVAFVCVSHIVAARRTDGILLLGSRFSKTVSPVRFCTIDRHLGSYAS